MVSLEIILVWWIMALPFSIFACWIANTKPKFKIDWFFCSFASLGAVLLMYGAMVVENM